NLGGQLFVMRKRPVSTELQRVSGVLGKTDVRGIFHALKLSNRQTSRCEAATRDSLATSGSVGIHALDTDQRARRRQALDCMHFCKEMDTSHARRHPLGYCAHSSLRADNPTLQVLPGRRAIHPECRLI